MIAEFVEHRFTRLAEIPAGPPDEDFFGDLVRGVPHHQVEIDRAVAGALAANWKLQRIDSILRAILRAAAYELIGRRDVPGKVVIDQYLGDRARLFRGRRARLRECGSRSAGARRNARRPNSEKTPPDDAPVRSCHVLTGPANSR